MKHTTEQVKLAIKDLPQLTEEQLCHNWKCAHSQDSNAAKALYKPFLAAIEKELRARKRTSTISEEEAQEEEEQ